MDADSLLPKLALALVPGIGAHIARQLMSRCESAGEIFNLRRNDLLAVPGIGEQLAGRIRDRETFRRAEEEIRFLEKERLDCHFLFDEGYPELLANCPDAPVLFFSRGRLPGASQRLLSVIGTRSPTPRGLRLTREIISGLAGSRHQAVIISGLAYGIDIRAHEAALDAGLPTIAVLGHGFHTIYPAVHRQAAERIAGQGALISDFFSHNLPEPKNFIRRNRIIAGMAEATLVVESGSSGGAMVTAEMANSYDRDVMAVPGRPDDPRSKGCNLLIRTNRASLVESAADVAQLLGWKAGEVKKVIPEPLLFASLEPEESEIFNHLAGLPLSVDQVSRLSGLPVQRVSFILLSLEFKGMIRALPGKLYSRMEA